MLATYIVWIRLVFSFFCYTLLGWLFAWIPWEEALEYNEVLHQSTAFTFPRIALIVSTLTLTLSFAWNKFGVMGWAKSLGWCYILSNVTGGILLLVLGGGITFYVVWVVVVSVAWAGAFSLVRARNQLLLSFSRFHTMLILKVTLIFGLGLGGLVRLSNL